MEQGVESRGRLCRACTPRRKRGVPSTSALGAMVSMFPEGFSV